jgi:DNA-binding NarL/FixJ family response regulator
MSKSRILLVEDHPIFRMGLAELINNESDLEVCGEAADIAHGLALVKSLRPDLAVIDLALQGRSGLELIKEIHDRNLGVPVLVVSMYDEALYAERALAAGAGGYVMKVEAPESITKAIRSVLQGRLYLAEKVMAQLAAKMVGMGARASQMPIERLTDRELEILSHIADGRTTGEIAKRLSLSPKTVGAHRENIKQKLGLSTAAELTVFALEWAKAR